MSAASFPELPPLPLDARPIRGPSALGGSFSRFVHLTRTLALTEFKLRFFGSTLGYLWQLMRPLMLFGVLYFVFTHFIRLGSGVRFYPAVLLTDIVIFQFLSDATSGAVSCVVDREGLVRKVQFPRLVIPLSVLLTAYINLALNMVAVLIFVLATGVEPHWTWFEFPLILLILGALATGIATLLSALYVRFRDVKPIWEVLLQIVYFGSPVLYTIDTLGSHWIRKAEMLNPLGAILQQTRHALIDPSTQNIGQVAGSWAWIAIPLAIVFGLLALGLWYFDREAPRIAEAL